MQGINIFNTYLILLKTYSVIIKFLIRPGGLEQINIDNYNGIDPFEMSCFRTLFNCTSTFFIMTFKYGRKCTDVPKHLYGYLLLRSVFGMLGFIALTFSIAYLPISIFNTLLNTTPFFTSIVSYYILGETL